MSNDVTALATTPGSEIVGQGGTLQKVETRYATAVSVQKPRVIEEVLEKCQKEAALAGEGCFYGWGAGKDRVEGPSIETAMIAVRNWGNSVVEMMPLHETSAAYILTAAFIDLETGFTYERQFRQSKKWKIYGRMDEERKADVRFQLGQSKAARNVVLRSLPGWLINKIIETAKKGVREKIEKRIAEGGIEAARKSVVDALSRYSVTVVRIEYKLARKYGEWGVDELVLLTGDIRALTDGVESAPALYPDPEIVKDQGRGSDNAGLSIDDMKPGDSANHQSVVGKTTDPADKPADGTSEPDAPTDTASPENVKEKQPDDAGAASDKKAEQPTREELVGRLLDLSEEKTPIVSAKDQKRINEIGLKHSDWNLVQLGAAVREIEGMKRIKKPEKGEQITLG